MPRYWNIVCEQCGNHAVVASTRKPRYCSRDCLSAARRGEIGERIGEPLDTAISRRYVLERKSYREIAQELGVNQRTVMRTLERVGIEPRQGSDAVVTQWENNTKRRKQIGRIFSKSSRGHIRELHSNWRGGQKRDPADKSWIEQAEKARERDGYRCTLCGITNEEHIAKYGRSLCVHHIVPVILSDNNSLTNLRTVCLSCHQRLELQFVWLL